MDNYSVRPLRHTDLAAVANLRSRCFQRSAHATPDELRAHIGRVFLDNPWREHGVESLVAETTGKRIIGFRGLLPRPMIFRGDPILAAVSSQVMVDPAYRRRGVAIAILSEAKSGPQDLLFGDVANAGESSLYRRVGGTDIPELRLYWRYPARPLQWAASRQRHSPATKWALRAARPLLTGLDHLLYRERQRALATDRIAETREMTLHEYGTLLNKVGANYDLRPLYTDATLSWTIKTARKGLAPGGHMRYQALLGRDGRPQGFAVIVDGERFQNQIYQVGVLQYPQIDILQAALALAVEGGCVSVKGRLQPELLAALAQLSCPLHVADSSVMMIARDDDIVRSVRAGQAWLTPLEGEAAMGF